MVIVDAHLDLAYNAVRGRRVDLPAREQKPDAEGIPTVGLPDLRAGGVNPVFATIFCLPELEDAAGYKDADEAHGQAIAQLDWYRWQVEGGTMKWVEYRSDEIFQKLSSASGTAEESKAEESKKDQPQLNPFAIGSASASEDAVNAKNQTTRAVLLLEGGDALRDERDVVELYKAGMRICGLAWKRTLHAGGTGHPGPLTELGIKIVEFLDRYGVIHDTSHLAEESFWQLLDISGGPVIASHSNCRAIVPTDRQLSDAMIRAVANRGGVIGMNFYHKFLVPPEQFGKRRATLEDVVVHVRHICDLLGNATQVGLGTDMDGGLGREQIPVEIETSADLHRVADALNKAGYSDADVRGIMGENWMGFLAKNLPKA
jgi:membrane dipeptidase